jgi:hypothetical protein
VLLPKPNLEEGMRFEAEILDTWDGTVTPVGGAFTIRKKDNYFFDDAQGRSLALPGRPWMAVRLRRVQG